MSKTTPSEAASVLPQPTDTTEVLTADQWGLEASVTEARVEMLNGFLATEKAQGRFARTRAEWGAAFASFANRPI